MYRKPIFKQSLYERKKRLNAIVGLHHMDKPIKPTKPKIKKPKPPSNVKTIVAYAFEHAKTKEVDFFDSDVPKDKDWSMVEAVNINLLKEFAVSVDADYNDVFVVPYDSKVEYRAIKKVPAETFQEMRMEYSHQLREISNEMSKFNSLMEQYNDDMETYNMWLSHKNIQESK